MVNHLFILAEYVVESASSNIIIRSVSKFIPKESKYSSDKLVKKLMKQDGDILRHHHFMHSEFIDNNRKFIEQTGLRNLEVSFAEYS